MLAVDFGIQHCSCPAAMVWRESLPPTATQSDAYRVCQRGDWLLWQLAKLPPEQYEALRPAIQRAVDRIVTRAIKRGLKAIEGIEEPWAEKWRLWAERWLSGEDRSKATAAAASRAVWLAEAEAEAAEASWAALAAEAAAEAAASWVALWAEAAAWSAVVRWAARAAWEAARGSREAAWKNETRLQAEDIHREIPTWPSE